MIDNDDPRLEILEPDSNQTNLTIVQINDFTQNPDLFIETLEKHDPGFIKKVNSITIENAKQDQDFRNKFGKFQAWISLFIASTMAYLSFGILIILIMVHQFNLLNCIGVGFIYAVTQGKSRAFYLVIEKAFALIESYFKDKKKS